MPTGRVKFFNEHRGFGFIEPDDKGADVFIHISLVEQAGLQTLFEGQRVKFEAEPDRRGKGLKATSIELV